MFYDKHILLTAGLQKLNFFQFFLVLRFFDVIVQNTRDVIGLSRLGHGPKN